MAFGKKTDRAGLQAVLDQDLHPADVQRGGGAADGPHGPAPAGQSRGGACAE